MNKRIKTLRKILTTISTTICAMVTVTAHAGSSGQWEVGVAYSYDGVRVKNMPLAIRNVPVHPDDGGGNTGPVARTSYSAVNAIDLQFGYVWNFESTRTRQRLGAGLKWLPFPTGEGGQKAERNYLGADPDARGTGTALTYVSFGRYGVAPSINPIGDIFLAWTPTLKYEIGLKEGRFSDFLLGAEVSYSQYRAENGWNRFGAKERNDSFPLADAIPIRTYVSYHPDGSHWGVNFGAQFLPLMKSSLGKAANITSPAISGFMAVTYGF